MQLRLIGKTLKDIRRRLCPHMLIFRGTTRKLESMGSGCGSVGRAAASNT